MKELKTASAEQTLSIGKKLGSILKKGDVVCLVGDLGTGKTALTHGIAEGLGIEGYITSPTFTIVNVYDSEIPLYHFDVYRIDSPDDMFEIGFEEYLYGDGVTVIEWADLIQDILPEEHIWVEIKKNISESMDTRLIEINFKGQRYTEQEKLLEKEIEL